MTSITEQSEQMGRSIHLGHGGVGVVREDLGVLRPLELVEQLSAQHDVEVLLYPRHHLVDRVLPGNRAKIVYCRKRSLKRMHRWGLIEPT